MAVRLRGVLTPYRGCWERQHLLESAWKVSHVQTNWRMAMIVSLSDQSSIGGLLAGQSETTRKVRGTHLRDDSGHKPAATGPDAADG